MSKPQEGDRHESESILVIDDFPENLLLLTAMLDVAGYKVRGETDGSAGLQAAEADPPSLILLDIDMPQMDGFKVCRSLKSHPTLKDIPVIFISGITEAREKVEAFRCGGVDYVTKPFQLEEVLARVQTHLKIRQLQAELEAHNLNLAELVHQRTHELEEAHKRLALLDKTKSDFLDLISHELRTPLTGILGIAEIVFEMNADHPDLPKWRDAFDISRTRMLSILDDALLLTQFTVGGVEFTRQPISLREALKGAVNAATDFAKSRNVSLQLDQQADWMVAGTAKLLQKAFTALAETAVKFAAPHSSVNLLPQPTPGGVTVSIQAQGRIIPAKALPRFFDVFAVADPITPGGDLGLGPPLAHRIISLCDGTLSVENATPPGVRFAVTLKVVETVE